MMESDEDGVDGEVPGALGALFSEAAADDVPLDGGAADVVEAEGARYHKTKKQQQQQKQKQKKRSRK